MKNKVVKIILLLIVVIVIIFIVNTARNYYIINKISDAEIKGVSEFNNFYLRINSTTLSSRVDYGSRAYNNTYFFKDNILLIGQSEDSDEDFEYITYVDYNKNERYEISIKDKTYSIYLIDETDEISFSKYFSYRTNSEKLKYAMTSFIISKKDNYEITSLRR